MKELILESIAVKQKLLEEKYFHSIQKIGEEIILALKNGNTVYSAGNGGSAADAQHFMAELAGKFETERRGLRGVALTTNTSNITAIGNDYGYEVIFSRQLEAVARPGDIFLGISTSGNSKNIIRAMESAKKIGVKTLGLLGNDGGKIKPLCDLEITVPSSKTSRIQECHILIIHILSKMVDDEFTEKL